MFIIQTFVPVNRGTIGYLTIIPRARQPIGLLTHRPEGERNNWFSKIQLVGQKISGQNIFRSLKLVLNTFLPSKHYKYGGRFLLLVGYNI